MINNSIYGDADSLVHIDYATKQSNLRKLSVNHLKDSTCESNFIACAVLVFG